MTCERQNGSQKHMMCGKTIRERLEILEPVTEDWHCMMNLLEVRGQHKCMHVHININMHETQFKFHIVSCWFTYMSYCRLYGRTCTRVLHAVMEL